MSDKKEKKTKRSSSLAKKEPKAKRPKVKDTKDSKESKPATKSISVLLAEKWDPLKHDPSGWWISEKLDGLRAYWDGKQFYSRLGHQFIVPEFVLSMMPQNVVLDGELFAGRGKFQVATSIVRTKKSSVEHDEEWKQMKFCCFDAPDLDKPFEERMDYIKKLFSDDSKKFCVALEHELCKDRNHLETKLKEIESLGGEGLMLREPASAYVRKRSWSLLKVKSVETEEYRILKHLPGKGKYVGKVGGFECETKEGEKFAVGSGLTDKERENPPNVGSLITVQYQELSTKGVPRFPIYKGVCVDKG